MKKLLVMTVAVSLCASVAVAGDHYPIRDSGINKVLDSAIPPAWDERFANMGAMTHARFIKSRQHFILMDFDWAAIEADMLANPGEDVLFSIVPTGTDNIMYRKCGLVLSVADADWPYEGDGLSQFTNFNWTDPTVNYAITSQYPQTIGMYNPDYPAYIPNPDWPPDPPDPTVPEFILDPQVWEIIVDDVNSVGNWLWDEFDARRLDYQNPNKLWFIGGNEVRAECVLDPAWLAHLIAGTDPDGTAGFGAIGFYTYDTEGYGTAWNFEAYLSEAGQDLSPRITIVPEPASMLLIGLGGIAMLLRKRR